MPHTQLFFELALTSFVVLAIYLLLRLLRREIFSVFSPNKETFQKMADEYSEFGNFTTATGQRTTNVDYLIDLWLKLKDPEPPIVVEAVPEKVASGD